MWTCDRTRVSNAKRIFLERNLFTANRANVQRLRVIEFQSFTMKLHQEKRLTRVSNFRNAMYPCGKFSESPAIRFLPKKIETKYM